MTVDIQPPVNPPANCGRRLIPQVIDETAENDPKRTFISAPRGSTAAEGYVNISYKTFATAVNRVAWYLEDQIGHSQIDATIFYIGPLDVSSHRNSLKAHLSLLDKTGCNICLEPEGTPSILNQILLERPMKRIPLADLNILLVEGDENDQVFPFPFTYEEMKEKTSIILHTSGSTGIPKPVYVSHGVFASQDAQQLISYEGGKSTWVDLVRGQRVFIGLPVFHAACLTQVGVSTFVENFVVVLPPPGPMNVDVVNEVFNHGEVSGALIAPSLIVDVYKNAEILANMLQRLQFLAYVGGTVSKAIGDDLCSKLHLITNFGSTETLSPPLEVLDDRKDWEYLSYSPCYGHEMRPCGDGLYELIIVRKPESAIYQGVFSTFPKLNEYSTSDLYEPHPNNKSLWRFRSRNDDIICFNNAEKLNPITMEATITGHPKVQSAVIGGHGQFQSCLLLEPKIFPRTLEEAKNLVDNIWPVIEEANKDCPAHGRLMRNFIMLSDPQRPLPRAGKDTVQRSAVFTLYEKEFLAIYNMPEEQEPLLVSTSGQLEEHRRDVDAAQHSIKADSLGNTIFNGITNDTAQPGKDSSIPISDIEAYINTYLRQQLPQIIKEYIDQSLGNAMSEMASSLLKVPSHSQLTNGVNNKDASANTGSADRKPELKINDIESFKVLLRYIIRKTTYVDGLTDEANMFNHGLDSIQVPELLKSINKALGESLVTASPIAVKMIYDNPSVDKLSQKLYEYANQDGEPKS